MIRAFLGLAVLAAVTLPAAAPAQQFASSSSGRADRFGRFASPPDLCSGMARRDGDRRGRRFDRCRTDVVMDWYGGEWALYNNRSFAPDGYNDWWHDRPDRAYPAWTRRNQGCQREWFAADTLTC